MSNGQFTPEEEVEWWTGYALEGLERRPRRVAPLPPQGPGDGSQMDLDRMELTDGLRLGVEEGLKRGYLRGVGWTGAAMPVVEITELGRHAPPLKPGTIAPPGQRKMLRRLEFGLAARARRSTQTGERLTRGHLADLIAAAEEEVGRGGDPT